MKQNSKNVKNEFIGMDLEGLSHYKENALMNKRSAEKGIQRIKERAKEEINEYKMTIAALDKTLAEIEEAENYLKTNKVEYQTIITVYHKNIYRRKPGTRPMYVGDISNILTYKGYYFCVSSVNNIDNPRDSKTLYTSNEFLMDEKALLREQIMEMIDKYNVKKIYLTREVSIGTKAYEAKGVLVEKRDYI